MVAAAWEIHAYQVARTKVINSLPASSGLINVSNDLVITLIASVIIDLIMLGMAWYFVRKWIMIPLYKIRKAMNQVARKGEIYTIIESDGPIEIAQVAQSAEEMRRNLVAQIDLTRSAEHSLQSENSQTLAGELRKALSPSFRQANIPQFEIDAYSQAAQGVISGDWWDVFSNTNETSPIAEYSTLVLVDVEGHDPSTGIIGLKIKSVIGEQLQSGVDPVEVVQHISHMLTEVDNKILSAFILMLPRSLEGKGKWLNAGHPPAVLLLDNGAHKLLEPTGTVVAGISDEWTISEFDWPVGATVVLSSDGLVELRNNEQDEFGTDGILQSTKGRQFQSPREMVNQIVADGQNYASDSEMRQWSHEDITVIAVTRQSASV